MNSRLVFAKAENARRSLLKMVEIRGEIRSDPAIHADR
jgi:hypothetical protein